MSDPSSEGGYPRGQGRSEWSIGAGPTLGFVLILAVLAGSTAWSYRNFQRVSENHVLVIHTHEVLDTLSDTLAGLADAETGQRGYLITGEPEYLAPYEAARASIGEYLARLKELTRDNLDQGRRAAAVAQMSASRLATLQAGIDARDAGGIDAGRQFILLGQGQQEMEAVRAAVDEMVTVENQLLARRDAKAERSYKTAVATLFVTAFVGLGLVGAAYVLTTRELRIRRHVAATLRRANDELETRVRERTSDLAEVAESLRRSNRELEQFASVASHDLQEPLRKIQAFGDRLQENCGAGLGDQGRQYVERMQSSATRMRNLIDALLTYSRVTTKAQPFVPVDLEVTTREVLSDLEGRLAQTGGRVEVGRLPTVDADPLQMQQLLQNLIGNALKFHKPGEAPVVRIESRLLDATGRNGDDPASSQCEVSVHDNGIGFEEIYLDRIFDVFQRLHGRQEYEGTGIGLAICRRIVERHRGSLTATSAPGRGATFLFTLPCQQREENR